MLELLLRRNHDNEYKNSADELWKSLLTSQQQRQQQQLQHQSIGARAAAAMPSSSGLSNNSNQQYTLQSGPVLYASQPNLCFAKLNKMSLAPVKISQNKFGFPVPRRIDLKSGQSQNVFFNISLAFPLGTVPIFRPVQELTFHNKSSVKYQIINTQDGSTYVSNLLMKITNNNRLSFAVKRGTIMITVSIRNALTDLHPVKVKRIDYNTSNNNTLGTVSICHE
jgi:hypothetical protein